MGCRRLMGLLVSINTDTYSSLCVRYMRHDVVVLRSIFHSFVVRDRPTKRQSQRRRQQRRQQQHPSSQHNESGQPNFGIMISLTTCVQSAALFILIYYGCCAMASRFCRNRWPTTIIIVVRNTRIDYYKYIVRDYVVAFAPFCLSDAI